MTKFLILILSLFLINSGSTPDTTQKSHDTQPEPSIQLTKPDIEGYVIKIKNQRALVVSSTPKDFSSTGGVKEFYGAVWVSNIPDDLKIGQKVQIWYEGALEESYPGQGKAGKIAIMPSKKPDKANLSEDEVVRKALTSKETSNINVFVIKDMKFDEQSDIWTISFKDGFIMDKIEEHTLQINDNG